MAAYAGWTYNEQAWLIREHRGHDKKSQRADYIQRTVCKPSANDRASILEEIEALDASNVDPDKVDRINKKIAHCELGKIIRSHLLKALATKSGLSQATLRDAIKEGAKANHQALVKQVINLLGDENLIYSKSYFWIWYDTGVWKRVDDRVVKQTVHEAYESADLKYIKASVDSIIDLVKTTVFKDGHQFDQHHDSINVLNGELVLDNGKWALQPHVREHYFTTQLPVGYDPDEDAPLFMESLEQWFEGDPDAEDKQKLLLELMGYTLLTTC